jgi:hypothetical protein
MVPPGTGLFVVVHPERIRMKAKLAAERRRALFDFGMF